MFLAPVLLGVLHAQQVPALPVYDAVTIKPNKTGNGSHGLDGNDTTLAITNYSLKALLDAAYDIKPDLISGIPPELASLSFDLNAKVLDPDMKLLESLKDDQRRAMILRILTDRFALRAHIEKRVLPLFEMTLLPGGPKFTKSPLKPDGTADHQFNTRNRSLDDHGVTMPQLAGELINMVHKTVVDRTGLAGEFDLTLKWSADDADPTTATEPNIYTALEEQLGLKLRAGKGPAPTLVVDHVELPSAN